MNFTDYDSMTDDYYNTLSSNKILQTMKIVTIY